MMSRFLVAALAGFLLAPGGLAAGPPSGPGPRFELRPGERSSPQGQRLPGRASDAGVVDTGERSSPQGQRFPGRASDAGVVDTGDRYWRVAGREAFVLGRNPAGMNPKAYEDHFRRAALAGESFMRIHFTYIPPGEKAGEIDDGMLKSWDAVLDAAERHGLAVLPVLGVWADWNDGSSKETWHRWDENPFNTARGGPAKRPDELLDDTPCRGLWLKRLATFVRRWAHRRAIVGWEIFSELDLVTGATEERAVRFVERSAAVIREADPWKRPVTASQAGINEWPELLKSGALDFIEVHPYADGAYQGRLDDLIIKVVRERLGKYGKPVLLGECGLSSSPPRGTMDVAERADIGVRHAIWASVVSGAMNGRMLWWQDGYDQFEKVDLASRYHSAAAQAAAFVKGIAFTGFVPVPCELSDGLKGAMIGDAKTMLGWFRDARCEPPDWPAKPTTGQTVTIDAPGKSWRAEFIDTTTGKRVSSNRLAVRNRRLRIVLPEFQESIAVQLHLLRS